MFRSLRAVTAVTTFALIATINPRVLSAQLASSQLALSSVMATPALALAPASAPASDTSMAALSGPRATSMQSAFRTPTEHSTAPVASARALDSGQSVTLMVVGGAGLIAGLVIGDRGGDAIAIGGALVGLYGLYEYMSR